MRIGVFAGDLFWSSCPYEHLNIANAISEHCGVALIMFEKDIRLNKSFTGSEKFRFETELYKNFSHLRVIKDWQDLVTISSDYDFIVSNCKVAPKTRIPSMLAKRGSLHCPIVVLDVGGTDQLTDCPHADLAVSKSVYWAENVASMWNIPTVSLGCHQYDYYLSDDMMIGSRMSKSDFSSKYQVNPEKSLLVSPTNPGSHLDMYRVGMNSLEKVCRHFADRGYSLLVKTYPHDYMRHEREEAFTGVYKRESPFTSGKSQYEHLSKEFGLTVVESQDHHAAVSWSKYMYNMSGSHIGWETHFTDCRSFSVGYGKQSFFGLVTARGKKYAVPDPYTTADLESADDLARIPERTVSDSEKTRPFMPEKPLVKMIPTLVNWLKVQKVQNGS